MLEASRGMRVQNQWRKPVLHISTRHYMVIAEDSISLENRMASNFEDNDLASQIVHSLFKELLEYYYHAMQHGNERLTFSTDQRTALESVET